MSLDNLYCQKLVTYVTLGWRIPFQEDVNEVLHNCYEGQGPSKLTQGIIKWWANQPRSEKLKGLFGLESSRLTY